MYCLRLVCHFLLLLLMSHIGSGLVVGAPSKLTLTTGAEGFKPTKLLLIISHVPPPAVISAHVLSHEHVVHEQLLAQAHLHASSAVSTTSLQTVHNNDPVVPSVTHTITQINHPHVLPHPASTVNGHSLGYGPAPIALYKSYELPPQPHENIYTVHVGGFGVGLHVGGHGHGHGYFAVL
ncbi:hypothetical protein B566_EDAN006884 [Ephemera danica]|nr:hypothetical protein B566_EDAN006884 [Ephemera danica]